MAGVTTGQKALEIARSAMQKKIGIIEFESLHDTRIVEGRVNWIIDFEYGLLDHKLRVYVKKQNGSVTYKKL